MSFLNSLKIRKKESQDAVSLVLQRSGQLVSLLKNIHNLTQTRPAKKSQKQTKHLGRCGLIPHFSFSPLLPSWMQSLVFLVRKQATASQLFYPYHSLVVLLCIPLTTIFTATVTNQKKNVQNGGSAWPSSHFLSSHGLLSSALQPFFLAISIQDCHQSSFSSLVLSRVLPNISSNVATMYKALTHLHLKQYLSTLRGVFLYQKSWHSWLFYTKILKLTDKRKNPNKCVSNIPYLSSLVAYY